MLEDYNWSKSEDAYEAKEEGRFPATTLAKMLKVHTKAIYRYLRSYESHFCSKFYNLVDYYDGKLLLALNNNGEIDEDEFCEEEIEEAKDLLAKMKAFRPEKLVSEKFVGTLTYLDFYRSSRWWKYKRITHENIEIEKRGCFYIFMENGKRKRKMITANGVKMERKVLDLDKVA